MERRQKNDLFEIGSVWEIAETNWRDGSWVFIILLHPLLCMFEIFHCKKLKNRLLVLLLLSHFSRVWFCVTPQMAAHQALCPWDSPGKNTGVGYHFLLQFMKGKSESEVAQSCLTLRDPMDCSLPGSSVHGFSRQEYWSGVPLPSPLVNET